VQIWEQHLTAGRDARFNMDIEVVSYPAVCAGGLILILLEVGKHIDTFPIFFWIWFIVYRLSFMKTAGSTGKSF
jgi:ABC-type multidrug transport system permease subunit